MARVDRVVSLGPVARFEDDMSTEWLLGREQLPPWNAIDWETDHDWDWRSAAEDTPGELYAGWTDAIARCPWRQRDGQVHAGRKIQG